MGIDLTFILIAKFSALYVSVNFPERGTGLETGWNMVNICCFVPWPFSWAMDLVSRRRDQHRGDGRFQIQASYVIILQ